MSGTPSIRISTYPRYPSPPRYTSLPASAAVPMAMPRSYQHVPPPLPPPTHIPQLAAGGDPGWQWGNDPNGSDFGRSVSVQPGSSLLGGPMSWSSRQGNEHDYPSSTAGHDARRGSSISTVTHLRDHNMPDADSVSPSYEDGSLSAPPSNYRLHGERPLERRTLEESSHFYDKQLLDRISGRNAAPGTPKRTSISRGVRETAQLGLMEVERRNSQLPPLVVPERRHGLLESPNSSRWHSSSGISPGFATGPVMCGEDQLKHNRTISKSPACATAATAATITHQLSYNKDKNVSRYGSSDHAMFVQDDLAEDGPMSHLNIYDRSPSSFNDFQLSAKAGSKRRASSPPRGLSRDGPPSVSNGVVYSDVFHKSSLQALPTRGSPVHRFHPSHSSISSVSSYGPRQNSLGSSLSITSVPSSATSYGSGCGMSPSAPSPACEFEPKFSSLGATNATLSLDSPYENTQRDVLEPGASTVTADSCSPSQKETEDYTQGGYICECCPKKSRRFLTEEDLRLHESEKQHICAYCPNRFKNKNEAERHQNSLHLRRHSWSCAALASVQAAFDRQNPEDNADVCGYCGEDFTNPPQWDVRAEHLNHVHKFGECNQAKKFFRADHFRQHLKHSHAGTSGKWTNFLENACMKDEPLPQKRVTTSSSTVSGQPLFTLLESTGSFPPSRTSVGNS